MPAIIKVLRQSKNIEIRLAIKGLVKPAQEKKYKLCENS